MGETPRHPLLVDTSSLVAVANTDLWDLLSGTLAVTTTNVCKAELKSHVDSATHPPEGSREWYLERGSRRALACLEDPDTAFSSVTVVPRPHGPDAGETSLQQEIAAHPAAYQVVSVLDSAARRSLRREIEQRGADIDVVGPPYLLYVLLDQGYISRETFCEATAGMLRTEGWTGYEVVKAAWKAIPVDCRALLDDADDVLPPE